MRSLVEGKDYTGSGTLGDPVTFAEHVNYFAGFDQYCRLRGLDAEQRRSIAGEGGGILDVVPANGTTAIHFKPPPRDAYAPPLAWRLVSSERGDVGRVTWRGGRDLEILAGPNLADVVRQHLDDALDDPSGTAVDIAMAAIEVASGGAVWAVKLPRSTAVSGEVEIPQALARMAKRALRETVLVGLGFAVFGLLVGGLLSMASLSDGFDGRSWFVIGAGLVSFVGGAGAAIRGFARWGANGTIVQAIVGGRDRVVWAYGREQTTTVHSVIGSQQRVEHGVTVHFEDGRRIDLPDDGTNAEDLLAWLLAHAPKAEIGYSLDRQLRHGVLKP